MKKSLMIVSALFISGAAMAQSGMNPGVTESTDQAKIAAIEQHAQQLTNKSGMQSMDDQGMDHKHAMKHHKKHHKAMHGHKKMAMKDGGDMKDSGAMKDGGAMKDSGAMKDGGAMKDSGAAMDSGATKNAPMKDNAQMKKGAPMKNKAAGDASMSTDKKN